jgi:hypothetical protein
MRLREQGATHRWERVAINESREVRLTSDPGVEAKVATTWWRPIRRWRKELGRLIWRVILRGSTLIFPG